MLYFLIFLPGYSCDIWFSGGLIHLCFPASFIPQGLCAVCSASTGCRGNTGWWCTGSNNLQDVVELYSRDYFFWSKTGNMQTSSEILTLLLPQSMLVLFKGSEEGYIFSFDRIIEVRLSTLTCTFWLFSQPTSFVPPDEAWPVLLPCCPLALR